MPKYIPSIECQPATVTANVRYGRENVYISRMGPESKGASASVMMVEDPIIRKVYGAKELYIRSGDAADKMRKR